MSYSTNIPERKKLLSYFYKNKTNNNSFSALKSAMNNDKNYGSSVGMLDSLITHSYYSLEKQKEENEKLKITFAQYINRELQILNARIFATHQYGITRLKKQYKKHYIMVTAFLNPTSHIVRDKNRLLQIRKIIKDEFIKIEKQLQYQYKKQGKEYKLIYLGVVEIDKNNHLHLHFYVYEDFNQSKIKTITNNIQQKINNTTLLKGKVNLKITRYKILNPDYNYSNLYHTLKKKMKGTEDENKVVLFALKKLFSRKKLIINSRLPFTTKTLQEEMKKRIKKKRIMKKKAISYPDLALTLLKKKPKKFYKYKSYRRTSTYKFTRYKYKNNKPIRKKKKIFVSIKNKTFSRKIKSKKDTSKDLGLF